MSSKIFVRSSQALATALFLSLLPVEGLYALPQASDLSADVALELKRLESIIAMTEENLAAQEAIKERVQVYRQLQESFMRSPKSGDHLLRMINASGSLLKEIERGHLRHVFSPEFLKQLELFSEPSNNLGIRPL